MEAQQESEGQGTEAQHCFHLSPSSSLIKHVCFCRPWKRSHQENRTPLSLRVDPEGTVEDEEASQATVKGHCEGQGRTQQLPNRKNKHKNKEGKYQH